MPASPQRGLRIRIVALSLTIAALAITSVAGALLVQHRRTLNGDFETRLSLLTQNVADYSDAALLFDEPDGEVELLATVDAVDQGIVGAVVFDANGRAFARHRSPPAFATAQGAALERRDGFVLVRRAIVKDGARLGTVVLAARTELVDRRFAAAVRDVLGLGVALLLVCLVLVLFLERYVTRPFVRLAATIEGIDARQDLGRGIDYQESDDMKPLYAAFNEMLETIRRRESEQARSESRLRALIAALPDVVLLVDREGVVLERLTEHAAIEGLSRDALRGKRLRDVLPPPANVPFQELFDRASAIDAAAPLEVELPAEDGVHRFELVIAPIAATHGLGWDEPAGIGVVLMRDVTEKRRLEAQFRQAQKLEAVGQLAGGIAHDFNNLLAGIMGFAEVLTRRLGSPQAPSYVEKILETSRRAADLVSQLLAFSRTAPEQRHPVDARVLVERVVDLLSHTVDRRIDVRIEGLDQETPLVADRSQLESALLNLGVNARDAMPSGGTLTFSLRMVEIGGRHGARDDELAPGSYVEIGVTDTGMGIPEEVQKRMFEPFFTTKPIGKGSGLGLAAVHGTVLAHGGAVRVRSEVGVGTTFRVLLPPGREPLLSTGEIERLSRGSGTVLLVDDEEAVRESACALLQELGYSIEVADDGRTAIELARVLGPALDLVVVDMIMPGLSGEETVASIRRFAPDAAIVAMSGFHQVSSEVLDRIGVTGFLKKPFDASALARALATALGRRERGGERPSGSVLRASTRPGDRSEGL